MSYDNGPGGGPFCVLVMFCGPFCQKGPRNLSYENGPGGGPFAPAVGVMKMAPDFLTFRGLNVQKCLNL